MMWKQELHGIGEVKRRNQNERHWKETGSPESGIFGEVRRNAKRSRGTEEESCRTREADEITNNKQSKYSNFIVLMLFHNL